MARFRRRVREFGRTGRLTPGYAFRGERHYSLLGDGPRALWGRNVVAHTQLVGQKPGLPHPWERDPRIPVHLCIWDCAPKPMTLVFCIDPENLN